MARSKTIANLRAILGLDSKRFTKGVDRASGKTKSFKKDLGKLGSSLRGLVAPLAAVFSVVAIRQFTSSTLESADAIRKLSARTGVGTDTIQELNHAFDLAGVAQERWNQGLLVFGKRIGKARGDTGALVEGLRKIDPSLLKVVRSSRTTTEALDHIFEAMAKARDEAERLAIADAAFGDAGLKMASAFEEGADSFRKAREQARELGLVISEDLLRNAEKTNDAFTTASKAISVQLKNAFLGLVPAITTALNWVSKFVSELREVEKINREFGKTLADRLLIMRDRAEELDKKIKKLREQLSDPIEAPANILFGRADELDKLEKERRSLEKRIKIAEQVIKTQGLQSKKTKEVVIDLEKVTEETDDGRKAAKNFTDELRDLSSTVRRIGSDPIPLMDPNKIGASVKALKPLNNNIEKALNLSSELKGKFDHEKNFNQTVGRLQKLHSIGLISTKVFDRAMAEAIRNTGSHFGGLADSAEDSMSDIVRVAQSAQGALEDGFTSAFDSIMQKSFDLRRVLSQVLGSIASSVFRMLVAQPISGGITSFIKGSIPGFAEGGRISGPSIVGERGPELFVPDTSGTIIPNHEIGMGSVSLNQVFNVDARGSNDPAAVERAVNRGIARAAPQIVKASVESVKDGRRRDPRFFE